MHKRERYYAMLNDNRIIRPFEWGTEFIKPELNGSDPLKAFQDHAEHVLANSEEFYALPEKIDFEFRSNEDVVTWPSAIKTPSAENNIARAKLFEHKDDKKAAVVVLPHWNAKEGTYFDLCKFFNKVGVTSLRLTLPYHEERMPPELDRADYLVSPNVGRTIESIRQAVLDTKAAVRWLKDQGYERVGLVGTSIGSCVGFLAAIHDENIKASVYNHVSGYVADVVWRGLSTYHVKEGISDNISLEDLRTCWLPVSPMAFMEKLATLPARPQRYIYTLYDLSFPVDLSRDTMNALNKHNIPHDEVSIPCGHYTLGEKPWVYIDGYKIIYYLRKHLR